MVVSNLPPAEMARFREQVQHVYGVQTELVGQELMSAVEQELKRIRGN